METSKLFERFERDIPSGASELAEDVDGFDLIGVVGVSQDLLISVADEASDDIIDIKSVFVTTIPVFLKKLLAPLVEAATGGTIAGFSDALRLAGIGANEEPTKSEYRLFVYRIGVVLVPASSTVCTSHTFSLLVFHSFIRAFRA